ncbi:tetratricopeptide repeat protein [Sphingomonas sp. MMS24-J13]|uniref:tetratricopeptide repeat protein n=1 Tax=Sphingomonas sp. MMS24-J13 TaxID=3238686 RepID=UPI00384E365D
MSQGSAPGRQAVIEAPEASGNGRPRASSTPPPRFLARTFGSFEIVDRQTHSLVAIRSRKATALIAYLAVSPGQSITRDRATGLLWGDRGEEQARASLRQALTELRATTLGLAGALRVDRREIALVPGLVETELEELAGLATEGGLAQLTAAVDRADGRPLADLDGIDNDFNSWLLVERERKIGQLRTLLLDQVQSVQADEVAYGRPIIASLQRIDPADEVAARAGLELDSLAGDLAGLHRRYRALERTLKDEYDTVPSPQTQDVFRRLTAMRPVAATVAGPLTVAPTTFHPSPRQSGIEPPVVLVLPIELVGGDSEDMLLAQVCASEIETALGGVADLRVLSVPEPSIERLEAAQSSSISSYSLKGSMRPTGKSLHLTWRLVRLSDGMVAWSRKSSLGRFGLGEAMDDVVAQAAGAVMPVVERDLTHRIATGEQGAETAYSLYLRGRTISLSSSSLDHSREAAALFEQAVARDPNLVNAHLSLARLYNTDFHERIAGHDPMPLRKRAFDLYSHAARISPTSALARAGMGWCYMRRADLRQANAKFEEALELCPNHADCLNELGVAYTHMGDLDHAGDLLRRAFELNPFPPDEYFSDMGVLQLFLGDHDGAEGQFEVSRHEALHYRAFRLANRALMGSWPGMEQAADEVRAGFRGIWQGMLPMTDRNIYESVLLYSPIHHQAGRDLFRDGLIAAGLEIG